MIPRRTRGYGSSQSSTVSPYPGGWNLSRDEVHTFDAEVRGGGEEAGVV